MYLAPASTKSQVVLREKETSYSKEEKTLLLPVILDLNPLEGVHGGWLCYYGFIDRVKNRSTVALLTPPLLKVTSFNMIKYSTYSLLHTYCTYGLKCDKYTGI